jgi:hypothetical protein
MEGKDMQHTKEDLVLRLHREEVERMRREGPLPPPAAPPGIPYTNLPEASPDSPLFLEWNAYRREVGRLLAEGKEEQFVLIKGQHLVGLYVTEREAREHGGRLFPCQSFLVHQVRAQEPLLRCRSLGLCRS